MQTKEILRSEWSSFFDDFSRRHESALVSLEVFGLEIGDQVEERELALEGITAEVSDAGDKIELMMGLKSDDHITHTVTAPTSVSVEQTDDGADAALLIRSADGTSALLQIHPPKAAHKVVT